MAVKLDLPFLSGSGEEPLLLDDNFKFYQAQSKGDAYVYVEKYAQKKVAYNPLPLGTASVIRPSYYLDKQTNYTDLGGGFVTFERHYARVPNTWFDYESIGITVEIKLIAVRSIATFGNLTIFNGAGILTPDSTNITGIALVLRFNPQNGGSTVSFLSKATRNYYQEIDLEALSLVQNIRSTSQAYFFDLTDQDYGDEPANFDPGNISQRIASHPSVSDMMDTITTDNPTLTNLPNVKTDEVRKYLSDIYEVKSFSLPDTVNELIGSDWTNLFTQFGDSFPTASVETITL